MNEKKMLIPVLLFYILFSYACVYIVLPKDLETPEPVTGSKAVGWTAFVTNIDKTDDGNLHIDITIRNDTGDWSAMKSAEGMPAVLTVDGKSTNCDIVFVSTGGHRLAPGFQLKGFVAGTKAEPQIQPVYVECNGVEAASGAVLTIDYTYFTGQYNYYEQDANKVDGKLELNLDEVVADLSYPIGETVDGLIQKSDTEIVALNKLVLTLTDVVRAENGLQFTWQTNNPSDYPSYVHIGNPPVIGEDGILYGYYETPDLASVPITPAGNVAEWTTEVAVPQDVKGLYIMLSVESGKARLFANYVIDVTDK